MGDATIAFVLSLFYSLILNHSLFFPEALTFEAVNAMWINLAFLLIVSHVFLPLIPAMLLLIVAAIIFGVTIGIKPNTIEGVAGGIYIIFYYQDFNAILLPFSLYFSTYALTSIASFVKYSRDADHDTEQQKLEKASQSKSIFSIFNIIIFLIKHKLVLVKYPYQGASIKTYLIEAWLIRGSEIFLLSGLFLSIFLVLFKINTQMVFSTNEWVLLSWIGLCVFMFVLQLEVCSVQLISAMTPILIFLGVQYQSFNSLHELDTFLIALFFAWAVFYIIAYWCNMEDFNPFKKVRNIDVFVKRVKDYSLPEDFIFVWGSACQFYILFDRRGPISNFTTLGWPCKKSSLYDFGQMQQIFDYFTSKHPELVIVEADDAPDFRVLYQATGLDYHFSARSGNFHLKKVEKYYETQDIDREKLYLANFDLKAYRDNEDIGLNCLRAMQILHEMNVNQVEIIGFDRFKESDRQVILETNNVQRRVDQQVTITNGYQENAHKALMIESSDVTTIIDNRTLIKDYLKKNIPEIIVMHQHNGCILEFREILYELDLSYFYNFNTGLFHYLNNVEQLKEGKFVEVIFSKERNVLQAENNVLSEKDNVFLQKLDYIKRQGINEIMISGDKEEIKQIILSLFCSPIDIRGICLDEDVNNLYGLPVFDAQKLDDSMTIVAVNN